MRGGAQRYRRITPLCGEIRREAPVKVLPDGSSGGVMKEKKKKSKKRGAQMSARERNTRRALRMLLHAVEGLGFWYDRVQDQLTEGLLKEVIAEAKRCLRTRL